MIWTSIKTQVLKDMKARIAELELSNRCLEEGLAVMTKNAGDNGNAAMRAEAERDALRGFLAERCLLSSFDGEPREEGE